MGPILNLIDREVYNEVPLLRERKSPGGLYLRQMKSLLRRISNTRIGHKCTRDATSGDSCSGTNVPILMSPYFSVRTDNDDPKFLSVGKERGCLEAIPCVKVFELSEHDLMVSW